MGILNTIRRGAIQPPEIADQIEISSWKKWALFLKYANAVITNITVFFITYPNYVIYFHFTADEINRDVKRECISDWGNYVLPYQSFCTLDEMFELNQVQSAHIVRSNSDCLPAYLFGKSVQLHDYKLYTNDLYSAQYVLSSQDLGLQGFVCCYLLLFLFPVLFILEETAIYNKLQFKHQAIGLCQFLCTSFSLFLQYQLIVDSVSLGPINMMIAEERCDSLYYPGDMLMNSILYAALCLILSSLLLPCLFYGALIGSHGDYLSAYLLTAWITRGAFALSGIGLFLFNVLTSFDLLIRLPRTASLFSPSLAFYNAGIGKIISLILSSENLFSILDGYNAVDACLNKTSTCSFPFWNENNITARQAVLTTENDDVEMENSI